MALHLHWVFSHHNSLTSFLICPLWEISYFHTTCLLLLCCFNICCCCDFNCVARHIQIRTIKAQHFLPGSEHSHTVATDPDLEWIRDWSGFKNNYQSDWQPWRRDFCSCLPGGSRGVERLFRSAAKQTRRRGRPRGGRTIKSSFTRFQCLSSTSCLFDTKPRLLMVFDRK